MHKPLKILMVGNFNAKDNYRSFYNCDYKFYFGLLRNGHAVYPFSNRDIARVDGLLRYNINRGAAVQNRRLLRAVREIEPHVLLLGHAERISNATLQELKAEHPHLRIGAFNVDALWVPHNLHNVTERSRVVDALFLTTEGEALRQFARPGLEVRFIPNPVDAAIDRYRCFANQAPSHDVFFAGGGDYRRGRCQYAMKRLPQLRFHHLDNGKMVYGQQYFREMTKCWIGLNLPQSDADSHMPPLYSSDRMAQYFGNGLLTLVHRKTGYAEYFTEGEEAFFYASDEELVEKLERAAQAPDEARRIAQNGRQKYHRHYNATLITRYMMEVLCGESHTASYHWPLAA